MLFWFPENDLTVTESHLPSWWNNTRIDGDQIEVRLQADSMAGESSLCSLCAGRQSDLHQSCAGRKYCWVTDLSSQYNADCVHYCFYWHGEGLKHQISSKSIQSIYFKSNRKCKLWITWMNNSLITSQLQASMNFIWVVYEKHKTVNKWTFFA